MANEEYLKILKRGAEVWNQWRQNKEIKIIRRLSFSSAKLSKAKLSEINLSKVNLQYANLSKADLRKADLSKAFLHFANLSDADLSGANLSGAHSQGVNLSKANLSRAKLRKAFLPGADLSGVNLSGANLSDADLSDANLSDAILREATLNYTDLSFADLSDADLSFADLSDAIFSNADLSGAILSNADLTTASLRAVRLIDTKLDGANLTGACLWETQRAGWSIKGVICEYVYWDKYAEEKTEYAPGEFERLFAEQTKIRLSYKGGISLADIATLPALIQHLEKMQGCALRFVSVYGDAGGAIVELAIEVSAEKSSDHLEAIKLAMEESAKRDIEMLRQAMTGKDEETKRLNGKVGGLNEAIKHVANILKENTGDTYNVNAPTASVGRNARAKRNALKSTPAKKTEDE